MPAYAFVFHILPKYGTCPPGPVAVRGDTASPSSAPGIVTEGSVSGRIVSILIEDCSLWTSKLVVCFGIHHVVCVYALPNDEQGESCQQKEYTTNAVSPLWYTGKISAREVSATDSIYEAHVVWSKTLTTYRRYCV